MDGNTAVVLIIVTLAAATVVVRIVEAWRKR